MGAMMEREKRIYVVEVEAHPQYVEQAHIEIEEALRTNVFLDNYSIREVIAVVD
jgi:hypothetical protein